MPFGHRADAVRVAICIPCHGHPMAEFTFCLARLIAATLTAGTAVEVETLIARSSLLVQSRTRLFEWAREAGAEYIFWLDADQTFAPETLLMLLAHGLPVVGANYRRRHAQVIPSAVKRNADGGWQLVATTPQKAHAGLVEPVDRIGFGCLLMKIDAVVEALGEGLYPLFEIRSLADGGFVGEDAILCDRLREAGLAIHIDHRVSILVGHIHEENLLFPQQG